MPLSDGIWQYTEADNASLVSDLLNLLANSTRVRVLSLGDAVNAARGDAIGAITERAVLNAAGRDTIYPNPTTAADRLAQQNRGAAAWRSDKGWSERYYAPYNATTNPGGSIFGFGWYPVSGRLPMAAQHRLIGAPQAIATNVMTGLLFPTPTTAFNGTGGPLGKDVVYDAASGVFTFPIGGLYRAEVQLVWAATGESSRRLLQILNLDAVGDPVVIEESRPSIAATSTVSNTSATFPVAPGASLQVRALHNSTVANVGVYGRVTFTYVSPC